MRAGRNRTILHDAPVSALAQKSGESFRHQKRPERVRAPCPLELIGFDVDDVLPLVEKNRRVVDEDIEAADLFLDELADLIDGIRIRNIQ